MSQSGARIKYYKGSFSFMHRSVILTKQCTHITVYPLKTLQMHNLYIELRTTQKHNFEILHQYKSYF